MQPDKQPESVCDFLESKSSALVLEEALPFLPRLGGHRCGRDGGYLGHHRVGFEDHCFAGE